MGCTRGGALAWILLLIGVAGCSHRPNPNPPSAKPPAADATVHNLKISCSGGGGQFTCLVKNDTDEKLGPFDVAVECLNERGRPIAAMPVENDQGIEPRGEWSFDLTVPTTTRSIRFARVIPRKAAP